MTFLASFIRVRKWGPPLRSSLQTFPLSLSPPPPPISLSLHSSLRRGLFTGDLSGQQTRQSAEALAAKQKGPLAYYDFLAANGEIRLDPHQRIALQPLQNLHDKLISSGFFGAGEPVESARENVREMPREGWPKGLYMFGDVGCGKTFLMDLFFECCPAVPKRRVHFHAFMLDVHRRIHRWRLQQRRPGDDDPIVPLVAALAEEARVLCFDEFQVTDVADAMILHRLFRLLLDTHGVVPVFTSNRAPTELYKHGLNRPSFLPFISFLHDRCLVHNLNSGVDYRLSGSGSGVRVYHHPLGPDSRRALDALFAQLSHQEPPLPLSLRIRGVARLLHVPVSAHGVARFTFQGLCGKPLGAADYLALAGHFHTLVLDEVPQMTLADKVEARRFITLVDALYEHKVKLICSADAPPHRLFVESKEAAAAANPNTISHFGAGEEEVFAFSRAVSRLIAMQSSEYLEAAHLRVEIDDE